MCEIYKSINDIDIEIKWIEINVTKIEKKIKWLQNIGTKFL